MSTKHILAGIGVILGTVFYPVHCIAEVYTIPASGEYTMSDYEEPQLAEQRALYNAQQSAAEKAGVYIKSYTRTNNLQVAEDEIKALASSKIHIAAQQSSRVLDAAGNVMIHMDITATVDTADVDQALATESSKRKQEISKYEDMQRQMIEQDKQIIELKRKIAQLPKYQYDTDVKYEQERADREFLSMQKVKAADKTKNSDEQRTLLLEAMKLDPKNASAYSSYAFSLYGNKKEEECLLNAHKTVLLKPDAAEYEIYAGFLCDWMEASSTENDFKRKKAFAYDGLSKLIEKFPESALIYTYRAICGHTGFNGNIRYYDNNEYTNQIIADYMRVVQIDPSGSFMKLGSGGFAVNQLWFACLAAPIYKDKVNWNELLSIYNRRIAANPQDTDLYETRIEIYDMLDQPAKMIADYGNILRLNPKDATVYYNRGNLYRKQGDYDSAISDYTQCISLNAKDDDAYFYRGYSYTEKHDYDHAIADYTKCIELNPKSVGSYNNRGAIYFNHKHDYDKAIADFQHAVELSPDDERYRENLQIAINQKSQQNA